MILFFLPRAQKLAKYKKFNFHWRGKAVLLSLFFLPLLGFANPEQERDPKILEVSKSTYWRNLLHYRVSFFGVDRSEVDSKEFFFSPKGVYDPYTELVGTVQAFGENRQVGNLKQHPQCAFPARYKFLKENLKLNIVEVECKEFRDWIGRFHPQSVTFVFAAPFLGSPASIFGHTFLRIDSPPRKDENKNDL